MAQVYVSSRTGKVFRCGRELKGFQKVFLKAGESRRVTIALDDKAFRFFNPAENRFQVETAHYIIEVGASAEDIRLSATLRILGETVPNPYPSLPSYESGSIIAVPDEEFAALLGHTIPESKWDDAIGVNDAISRFATAKSPVARWLCRYLEKRLAKRKGTDMTELFILNMPIRAMAQMTGGRITPAMTEDIAFLANGHFLRGSFRMIRHYFAGRRAIRQYQQLLDLGPEDK